MKKLFLLSMLLVPFLVNGAGITIRRDEVAEMFRTNNFAKIYNVEHYGADHNPNTTNDHFAFQYAVSMATNTGGGTIYLPPGNYYVDGFTYYPAYASEGQPSSIVFHSNAVYRVLGPGAKIVLRTNTGSYTTPSQGSAFVLFGSGNHNAGAGIYTWNASPHIEFDGLEVEAGLKTWLYDASEGHNGQNWRFDNMIWRNGPQGADCIDVNGYVIAVNNNYFSNWHGSLFHPDTTGDGSAVMKNSYAINCNNVVGDNPAVDTSLVIGWGKIENCIFTNMLYFAELQAGRFVLEDVTIDWASHTSTPFTNIHVRNSKLEVSRMRMNGKGTVNTIGPFVVSGTSEFTGREIVANSCKMLWTTNAYQVDLTDSIMSYEASILLGGNSSVIRPYRINRNTFFYGGTLQAFDANSTSHNVDFYDNLLVEGAYTASGTNWTFSRNRFQSAGVSYLRDSTAGNSRFIENYSVRPSGNLTCGIRLQGPTNFVSGNSLGLLYFISSSSTYNTILANTFGNVDYFGGASEATAITGPFQMNFKPNGAPWFTSVLFANGGALTNVVLTGPTNGTAPSSTVVIKSWANFTNSYGDVFKLPLYQ